MIHSLSLKKWRTSFIIMASSTFHYHLTTHLTMELQNVWYWLSNKHWNFNVSKLYTVLENALANSCLATGHSTSHLAHCSCVATFVLGWTSSSWILESVWKSKSITRSRNIVVSLLWAERRTLQILSLIWSNMFIPKISIGHYSRNPWTSLPYCSCVQWRFLA